MKYKLAIFDMDGTILDTLKDLAESTNYVLQINSMPQRTISEIKSFVGNGMQKLIERAVPKGTDADTIQRILEEFKNHYAEHCKDNTGAYNGINELLRNLRNSGIKTAVVSNKGDFAVQELCRQFFPDVFAVAVGERENVRRKPAPDSVNEVLNTLKIQKKDAVYIGDSEVDIETAKNAGVDCISVSWGFRSKEILAGAGASKIVDSTEELRKTICAE